MGYPQQSVRPYQSLHHPLKLQSSPKSLSSFSSIDSFDDYCKYNKSISTSIPTNPTCIKSKSKSNSTSTHLPRRPPGLNQPKFILPNLPENARSTLPFPSSYTPPTIKLDKNSLNHKSSIDSIRTPTSNLFPNPSQHSTKFLEDLSPSSSNSISSSFDPFDSPPSSSSSTSSYFPSFSLKPIIKRKSSKLFQSLNSTEIGNKKSNSDLNSSSSKPNSATSYSPKPKVDSSYSPKPHSATSYSPKPHSATHSATSYSPKPKSEISCSPKPKSDSSYSPKSNSATSYSSKPHSATSYSPKPKSEVSFSPKPPSETSYFSDSSSDSETALIETSLIETHETHQTSSNNLWWWEKVNKYRKNSLDSNLKLTFEKKEIKKIKLKTKNTKIDDWFLILNKEKYHPFEFDQVPYWMSYQHEVLDHHILMMYACSPNSNPFKTLTKPIGHQKILDLGCGPYGIWCNGVIKFNKNPELEIIGLDICPIQLKKLPIQMKFVQHDFLKSPLPFSNHTFDQVNASFLGSGIPEKKWNYLISEIFRILKPGQHLTINETNYDSSTQLENYLKSQMISSHPISIIPSELSLIGNHLKRSKVLFNEIPTSIFQNPILSTLENQRLLLSTRESLINSSNSKIKSKTNLSTKPNPNESKGEIVGLLKERFNWVCSMDIEIKEILEKRLKEMKETYDWIQPILNENENGLEDFNESEIEFEFNDQLKDLEIKNKFIKLIHSIEFDLNLINERLFNNFNNFELELDQNSIQIETFSVRTYRDKSLVYL